MKNKKVTLLVQSSLLLAVTIVFQFIGSKIPGLNQYLVGSIVNAVLLTTTYICGTFYGAAVGVLTPWTALLVGQLKPQMVPFIPFIMAGNAIYVIVFGLLCKKTNIGKYIGILSGAALKFAFLYLSVNKLIHLFALKLSPQIQKNLAVSMGMIQLFTALIGGAIALVLIEILFKKLKITKNAAKSV